VYGAGGLLEAAAIKQEVDASPDGGTDAGSADDAEAPALSAVAEKTRKGKSAHARVDRM
jgi:hypothetical protein